MNADGYVVEKVMKRLLELSENNDFVVPKHHIRQLLQPGLAIVHLKSKLRYTVASQKDNKVTLSKPDGTSFEVSLDKFEKDYAVD